MQCNQGGSRDPHRLSHQNRHLTGNRTDRCRPEFVLRRVRRHYHATPGLVQFTEQAAKVTYSCLDVCGAVHAEILFCQTHGHGVEEVKKMFAIQIKVACS